MQPHMPPSMLVVKDIVRLYCLSASMLDQKGVTVT
jgi:hypothetical protein